MRKSLILLGLLFILSAMPLEAARLISGSQAVVPGAGPVQDDLYISGGNVLVDKAVNGDLLAAGGQVTISAPVQQDLAATAGTLVIGGRVGDDARLAGGNITISAPVGQDLVIAGGNVTIAAPVGRDLIVWGGNVTVNAAVGGRILGNTGNLSIFDSVGRGVNVAAGKLTLGPNAVINGDLVYRSAAKADISPTARITGQTTRTMPTRPADRAPEGGGIAGFLLYLLWSVLAVIATGLVLIYLLPAYSRGVINLMWSSFWKSLGLGFLILFLTPIAAVLLAITVIGIPLAMILMLSWVILLTLAWVYATIFAGWLVVYLIRGRKETWLLWGLLAGAVIFQLLNMVPIVGWIVAFALYMAALGALCWFDAGSWWGRYGYGRRNERE